MVVISYNLVGGIPTPLKNMKVSWADYSQLFLESYKNPWFQTTNQVFVGSIMSYPMKRLQKKGYFVSHVSPVFVKSCSSHHQPALLETMSTRLYR